MSVQITDGNFNEITATGLSVVDFWAAWCGPCRMLGPIIDGLSEENKDIVIGKVNVDENQVLASTFGIRSIPTVLFFKDGQLVDRIAGAQPKATYQAKINQLK